MDRPSQTVWVVDDDESVCKALGRLLRSFGLNVKTFATAEAFLARADSESSDCLILDVCMPGMSGLELQKRLGSVGSQIPIVFISAYEDPRARDEALGAGAVNFLIKPFDEQGLLLAVSQAIGKDDKARRGTLEI